MVEFYKDHAEDIFSKRDICGLYADRVNRRVSAISVSTADSF